jgi:hypothetical protein
MRTRKPLTEEQKERQRESHRRYSRRKKAEDPDGFRARAAADMRKYWQQRKERDPEGLAERRKASRVRSKANLIARDPAGYAERIKQGNARYIAKKRSEQPEKWQAMRRGYYRRQAGVPRAVTKRIMDAVQLHCPADIVGDVLGLVWVEFMQGRMNPDDAMEAVIKQQITAHRRQFSQYTNLSLDAQNPVTGRSYIENLASDADHF